VDELKARGNRVSVVTTGEHEEDGFYEVPGFTAPGVKEAMENTGFLFGKGKKDVYREAFQGADLVQVQFPFIMARNAVKMAKRMGVPIIGACHVQPQNVIAAMGKESVLMEKMLFALFNFLLFKKVDAIHCPSVLAAEMLRANGVKAHLRVISNGIPRDYVPREYPRPDWFGDRFVLMSLGRHALEKRQELMIEAVLRSKHKDNIQLVLCGQGDDTEKLKKQGEALPIKPFIDYVSHEEKLTYLNTADIYLQASVVELESLSCLEAVGCGLPCLIGDSPNSAATQFAQDDRFIFKKDNPDDLSEKIDYWFENRKSLAEIKKDVLRTAEMYRVDRCIDLMEAFYRDILNHNLEMDSIQVPGVS
jgi:1,2-diacylglycerol 3-alpha-glucosyltransferase